jgi:anaerobic sulfite reductase subunit C
MNRADEYKKNGFIEQRQKGYFAMRIRTRAGNMTSEQIRKVADLADKYGQGQLHFTTRQAVEMYWVPEIHYDAIIQETIDANLLPAVCGPRMRTIVACPGSSLCKFGLRDTVSLASELDELFVGQELPAKTKLGVSGCPNSCTKPQENDIGLQGAVQPVLGQGCVGCGACIKACKAAAVQLENKIPVFNEETCIGCGQCLKICPTKAIEAARNGYNLYVGGKIGRFPQLGKKTFDLIDENEVILYLKAVLSAYQGLAMKGERIAQMINRLGLEVFKQEIHREVSRHKQKAV